MKGRTWKLIGLAGVAGVAATGVLLTRDERRRRAYTPDEVRARLLDRHAEAVATGGARAWPANGTGPGVAGADGAANGAGQRSGRVAKVPDPVKIARYETDAWVGYYLRDWGRFLRGALGMVREGFGTTPAATVRGAWFVLRANQAWAPFPDNDPDAARAAMARFYRIAARAQGWTIDPEEAARREVLWWAAHREVQRIDPGQDDERLVGALADLYAYVYTVPAERMRPAAVRRAAAMRISDAWVADGCRPDDQRLAAEEAELVRSYTALRDVLHR